MNGNRDKKLISKVGISMLATLAIVLLLILGGKQAAAQACAAQNWAASTPNVWAAGGSIKVMLNNNATTNQPTIPTYINDGNFDPWGFVQHPQAMSQLNEAWSCPSGTPVITMAGSGRETVSFQVFISASASAALSDVTVAVSPLTGAGTLTSDNTGTSNVTRYLEGYVPYTGVEADAFGQLQANGQMPDPLIPFYDPYDTGNPAVATPFNVQSGTTQGVWVNISIPASQAAGAYAGTVTVTGNGIGTVTIPVSMTVWNGNLPTFDAGSVNTTYADMLRSWLPFYESNFDSGEAMTCSQCSTEQTLFQKYQVMGHAYDMDMQFDGLGPTLGATYPTASGTGTSYTVSGPGSASTIDWTEYDTFVGPALTPGGLFSDGTYMRVFDSPLSTAGGGAWVGGGYSWYDSNWEGNAGGLPPSGLLQLFGNYATQISQHFASNHTTKSWGLPELISYTYDETYNTGGGQLGGTPLIYQNISLFNEAMNSSNTALSSTWAASTEPIHNFLTDEPACQEDGDNTYYTNSVCADHLNLSYPGGTDATPGYTNSWVINWSSNPTVFMPGQPGPALNYGVDPTIIAGTGYQYTYDLSQGVPALSTAPIPVERWFYQGGDPFSSGDGIAATGVGQRINYWIAYKYGLDETIASVGDPSPAAPAPGAVWVWVGDFWGGYNGNAEPNNCADGTGSSGSPAPSPFVSASTGGDGMLFYPGNEIGCYYSANPVGEAVLTANPAVNTSCTSNGYSVCNGISGPVASMRMEAMRRGYEDYEYMYLLGKQSGRAAPLAIINAMGGANMTAGGLGTTSWGALDWENTDGPWYAMGVLPQSAAYSGNCVDNTPGIGGLPNGLPNGPTGAASSGFTPNYQGCNGEWTNNPYRYEAARVQMAEALGFAPASTAPSVTGLSPSSGANSGGTSVGISGTNFTGATEVQFGGVEATSFTVHSSTSITAVSPAGNGTVDVQVFGPGGGSLPNSSDLYNYTTVATPTFSPGAGTYTSAQTVTISSATLGATIYYTTNGTTPTTSSTLYSGPISVSTTETVEALAVETGYTNSAIGSAAYTIGGSTAAATPTFSPAAGTYNSPQTVTISDATSGATIYYTTNGSTPTTSSPVYSSPIAVSATETVKAIATATGYKNSAVGSAKYTLKVATPTFSPAAGTYSSAQTVTISTTTPSATIHYTTNGTTPTTSSPVYSSPINVSTTETVKALAAETGYTNSAVGSAKYTIK